MSDKPLLFIFFTLLAILLLSCSKKNLGHSTQNTVKSAESTQTIVEIQSQNDSILFLFFSMYTDTIENKTDIKLTEIKKVAGKTKQEFENFDSLLRGKQLTVQMLSEGNEVIKQGSIEHPLKRRFEYIDDDGNYRWVSESLTQTEFFIKLNYNSNFKFIKFSHQDSINFTIPLF